MTEPAYLAPGTLLRGRYEILREIGRGGFSVVYLARDREVEADVAVKLLVPPPAAAKVARERMRREVQAVRGLSHANIVAVFDFLEEGPWSFIVMEYVAGPDLQVRVRDRGALDGEQAVGLGRDIAAALSAAHRRGILHRDVKPQNILLDPDGRARLTDFGSAKLDGQIGVTATGALAGTLAYTAPEVLAGRRGDARADVYALGLTLYYALTGELPQLPSAQLAPAPAPGGYQPRTVTQAVPPWLDGVIARATTAAPENRFPTATAFDKALAQEDSANLPAEPASGARCLLCGGPDPLGLALCYACGGGSNGAADTLVFLDPPSGPAQRRDAEARLVAMLPGYISGTTQALRGSRPLFRVSGERAPRVLEELARRRLPARSLAARRAWSRLPAGVFLTVGSVLAGGGITGLTVMPLFLWTTPLFALLLLVSARRELTTPVVTPPPRRAELPPALEREVLQALTRLPDGTARSLLADITRMSDGLFGRLRRSGDIRNLGPTLTELLTASSAAAADLASLDDSLFRLERQREKRAELPAGWLDALSRCERSRDGLVQRLLEAMTVLGRLQSTSLDSEPELAEITKQLQGEASAQSAAVKEIEQLLSPRHS